MGCGIGSIDDLVEKEEIGSDDSFELLVCFYFCSLILKVFLNIQKNQDFFQARPNPKSPNDPWLVSTLSLIWWEMNCKIDLWCISVGIEMKQLYVWELYTFERFSSAWVNQVFSLMFFRTKCELILISFGGECDVNILYLNVVIQVN